MEVVTQCFKLLLPVTQHYTAIHSVTQCCKVLLHVTQHYTVLRSVTVLQSIRKCYTALQSVTRCYTVFSTVDPNPSASVFFPPTSADHRHPHQSHHQRAAALLRHHRHRHQTGDVALRHFPVCLLPECNLMVSPSFLSLSVRQGYEDWLRHKADNSVNLCPVHVMQHGKVVRQQSRKIRVRPGAFCSVGSEDFPRLSRSCGVRVCMCMCACLGMCACGL